MRYFWKNSVDILMLREQSMIPYKNNILLLIFWGTLCLMSGYLARYFILGNQSTLNTLGTTCFLLILIIVNMSVLVLGLSPLFYKAVMGLDTTTMLYFIGTDPSLLNVIYTGICLLLTIIVTDHYHYHVQRKS